MRMTTSAFLLALLFAVPASPVTVYTNDFSTAVGPNLTVNTGSLGLNLTPNPSGCTYCGSFLGADGQPLDNHTVTLSLDSLAPHSFLTISLDLFILTSWDGNSPVVWAGPDYWSFGVDGTSILYTTFSNVEFTAQSYPDAYPSSHPRAEGAVAVETLGYYHDPGTGPDVYGDAVYHLVFNVPHTASSAHVTFAGSNLQGWSDEGWGIDNLQVDAVPEPASFLLLGAGLIGLGLAARRRS